MEEDPEVTGAHSDADSGDLGFLMPALLGSGGSTINGGPSILWNPGGTVEVMGFARGIVPATTKESPLGSAFPDGVGRTYEKVWYIQAESSPNLFL